MARLCLLGPNQLGSNPRLLRNADCLAATGHDVTVVYPDHLPRFRGHDAAVIAAARWRAVPLDFCTTPLARLRWQFIRLRHRAWSRSARAPSTARGLERAYGYFGPELAAAAIRTRPQLVLAQQQMTLPAAARAAAAVPGARYAVDIEDLVAESSSEPVALVRAIEERHVRSAAFVATMSEAAADRLRETYQLPHLPLVLHNCPSLGERAGLPPPSQRPAGGIASLYWFGQTVGPHACAEVMLEAMAQVRHPTRLVLRGNNPLPDYLARLRALAAQLGLRDAITIEPSAPPTAMVRLAGEHTFCFGTQPGTQLFHQLAIGNKVFTGLAAGCAVALTDTVAHRRLLAAYPDCAFTFGANSPAELAAHLNRLLDAPAELAALRQRAWDLAGSTLHWDHESRRLTAAVAASLSAP